LEYIITSSFEKIFYTCTADMMRLDTTELFTNQSNPRTFYDEFNM
jgi:hypothetical protein